MATRRYREMRERAGLKAEQACVGLGISYSTLMNYEGERTRPTDEVIANMSTLYGCSLYDLLGIKQSGDERAIDEKPRESTDRLGA